MRPAPTVTSDRTSTSGWPRPARRAAPDAAGRDRRHQGSGAQRDRKRTRRSDRPWSHACRDRLRTGRRRDRRLRRPDRRPRLKLLASARSASSGPFIRGLLCKYRPGMTPRPDPRHTVPLPGEPMPDERPVPHQPARPIAFTGDRPGPRPARSSGAVQSARRPQTPDRASRPRPSRSATGKAAKRKCIARNVKVLKRKAAARRRPRHAQGPGRHRTRPGDCHS